MNQENQLGRRIANALINYPIIDHDLQINKNKWFKEFNERKSSKLRVLFCHAQLPKDTGSGVYFNKINQELAISNVDVYLLSATYKSTGIEDFENIDTNKINSIRFTLENSDQINEINLQIPGMSTVMPYPNLPFNKLSDHQLFEYLSIFYKKIYNLIVTFQPNIIHNNHLWFLNGISRLIAPWIPIIVSAHGTASKLLSESPQYEKFILPAMGSVNHVCAISKESKNDCVDKFKISRKNISIEGYGFNPSVFYYKKVDKHNVLKKLGVEFSNNPENLILFVGKFVYWKGIDTLINAIHILDNKAPNKYSLLIIGEGDTKSRLELESLIKNKSLEDKIKLPGKVSRKELPDIYRIADTFVLSSFNEPWGLVLMEALACGTPSVCPNIGAPPEYIPHKMVEVGIVKLITPIKLNKNLVPSFEDKEIYSNNILIAIENNINFKNNNSLREELSMSMRYLSWNRLAKNLVSHYQKNAI